jgi:hypothetical protein
MRIGNGKHARRLRDDALTMRPGATPALEAVATAAVRVRDADQARRDAIGAAFDAGASPGEIAKSALLSHAEVRRIVGDRRPASPAAYIVALERRGVSPLDIHLVVRADCERDAAELASWIAERKRGGVFEATAVRRATSDEVTEYDDADL